MYLKELKKVKSALDGQLFFITSMATGIKKDSEENIRRSIDFTYSVGELYLAINLLKTRYIQILETIQKYAEQDLAGTYVDPSPEFNEEGEEPWDVYRTIGNNLSDGNGNLHHFYTEFDETILEQYQLSTKMKSTMMGGFRSFFPTVPIMGLGTDGNMHELPKETLDQMPDKALIASLEREFSLSNLPEFLTEVLAVCEAKGDLVPILKRI